MNRRTAMTLPARARRRRWPLLLALLLALGFGAVMLGWGLLEAVQPMPIHVTVDGERVVSGLDLASLPPAHKVFAAVVACVLLLAIVLVPVALVLSLGLLLLILLLAVGLPLVAAGAVLAVVLSPLLLAGWLLWSLLT